MGKADWIWKSWALSQKNSTLPCLNRKEWFLHFFKCNFQLWKNLQWLLKRFYIFSVPCMKRLFSKSLSVVSNIKLYTGKINLLKQTQFFFIKSNKWFCVEFYAQLIIISNISLLFNHSNIMQKIVKILTKLQGALLFSLCLDSERFREAPSTRDF